MSKLEYEAERVLRHKQAGSQRSRLRLADRMLLYVSLWIVFSDFCVIKILQEQKTFYSYMAPFAHYSKIVAPSVSLAV